jgi:hypothetical protein
MMDEETRKKGWELFCTEDAVRRITETLSAVKTPNDEYHLPEFKDGKWLCTCRDYDPSTEICEHIYAAQLARDTKRSYETEIKREDEANLACRYCGSPDLRKCGFRYNHHGIAHRYYCYRCERKFSIRVIDSDGKIACFPQEVVWLLDQVGRLTSRLNQLLLEVEEKLTRLKVR